MTNRPAVLVLDDGELDNVYRMLVAMGTDVVRLKGAEIGRSISAPRDLLISAGRRTLTEMPQVILSDDAPESPIWICVHGQDFLPMRERLREMGVHYLLQNALDEQSRLRFLTQLLRKGAEQRGSLRLHLGGEIRYRADGSTKLGMLVELSLEGCRILTQESFDPGTPLSALLPAALGGGSELELTGVVLRATDHEASGGRKNYATVIRFEGLDTASREHLEGIIRGERIGTKITPLASLGDEAVCGAEDQEADPNRRAEVRQDYRRPAKVFGFEPSDSNLLLGCDLSLSGVRLSGCLGLLEDAHVTVALFGEARDEPTVLEATVVRASQDGEVALAFNQVSSRNQKVLEKLLRSQPELDALDQPDPSAGRTIVAAIRNAVTA